MVGHDIIECREGLFVSAHAELAFSDPILSVRGQGSVPVEFEEQSETGQRGFVVAVLEFLHHAIVLV